MDYPSYELLFCVKDHDDPAIEVVHNLMNKYPQVDAKLLVGGSNVGINPKVNNMNPGYETAKYDLILISDDKMLIQPEALLDMVDCLNEDKVGIVNQMPYYTDREGIGRVFDKLIFANGMNQYLLLCGVVDKIKCTGMSSLFEKKIVDCVGGLKYFGQFLSEDFRMIEKFQLLGYEMKFSRQFGLQNPYETGVGMHFNRIVRWFRCDINSNLFLLAAPVIM